jgi:hypothetical protein
MAEPRLSEGRPRMARLVRAGMVSTAVVLASVGLVLLRTAQVTFTDAFPTARLNHEVTYQTIGLAVLGVFVLLSWVLGGPGVFPYLRPNRFSGEVRPVPWLGIRPKAGEDWVQTGGSFLIVITVVTAIAVYLPVIRGGGMTFGFAWVLVPAVVFAVTNSIVEEGIYRFSVTSVFLENGLSARSAAISSGLLFGGVHYFGMPGGVPGVFLAGFLGWLLSKSIAETKSIGWAWLIHFVQDVVIFVAIFGTQLD